MCLRKNVLVFVVCFYCSVLIIPLSPSTSKTMIIVNYRSTVLYICFPIPSVRGCRSFQKLFQFIKQSYHTLSQTTITRQILLSFITIRCVKVCRMTHFFQRYDVCLIISIVIIFVITIIDVTITRMFQNIIYLNRCFSCNINATY